MNYFAHDTALIERGCQIGTGTKIWHLCHLREGVQVGAECVFGRNVYIESGAFIGAGVHVQNNVSIYNGVQLHDGVFVGPSVVFTNDKYPRAGNDAWTITPTIVCRGASIGAGAVIVCGVRIGEGAMIGAGAVVRRDVQPNEVYTEYGRGPERLMT